MLSFFSITRVTLYIWGDDEKFLAQLKTSNVWSDFKRVGPGTFQHYVACNAKRDYFFKRPLPTSLAYACLCRCLNIKCTLECMLLVGVMYLYKAKIKIVWDNLYYKCCHKSVNKIIVIYIFISNLSLQDLVCFFPFG